MIKTKRILALLLSAAMTISLLPTFTLTASADALTPLTDSESGTTLSDTDGDGAYEIGTKADLIAFSNLVNAGNTTINAKVTADIEFNSEEVMDGFTVTPNKVTPPASAERFTPIGKSTALLTRGATAWGLTYRGTFDGDNHTISGIYVGDPGAANSAKADIDGTYARGLFGYVGPQGVVKNLKVKNSCIYGNYSTGGIVGCLVCGTVENCSYTDGSVYGIVENLTGESGTGGIVGVATLCRLSESLSTDKNDVGA